MNNIETNYETGELSGQDNAGNVYVLKMLPDFINNEEMCNYYIKQLCKIIKEPSKSQGLILPNTFTDGVPDLEFMVYHKSSKTVTVNNYTVTGKYGWFEQVGDCFMLKQADTLEELKQLMECGEGGADD